MKIMKSVCIFICSIFFVSFIIGFILSRNIPFDYESFVESLHNHNNVFVHNFVIYIVYFLSCFSLIGIAIQYFILALESVSIGYIVGVFITNCGIKGIVISFLYIFINKILFILILLYLAYISILYLKRVIKYFTRRNIYELKRNIINTCLKFSVFLGITIILSLVCYLSGNYVVLKLINVLK